MEYNFYPGPSKLYDLVPFWTEEAFKSGIVSKNHRSKDFMILYEETTFLLKKKLNIPTDYSIYFVSSATECWEIITQSFPNLHHVHYSKGSFGDKWFEYAKQITDDIELVTDLKTFKNLEKIEKSLICLTSSETSNGTMLSQEFVDEVRALFPNHVIAYDATSNLGAVNYALSQGDIWFASVQKCFGLPAGLAILICSPQAIQKASQNKQHYNSLCFLEENYQQFQTHYTPNILGIYLLHQWANFVENITLIHQKIKQRSKELYLFFDNLSYLNPLIGIENHEDFLRSETVITLKGNDIFIQNILKKAQQKKIILGKGYGKWKNDTLRIANFPQITHNEFEILKTFFLENPVELKA
jgi:phosphoserine aminotransferase